MVSSKALWGDAGQESTLLQLIKGIENNGLEAMLIGDLKLWRALGTEVQWKVKQQKGSLWLKFYCDIPKVQIGEVNQHSELD